MILKSVIITFLFINISSYSYCNNCDDNGTCSLPKTNSDSNNKAENVIENNDNKDENDNKIKDNND